MIVSRDRVHVGDDGWLFFTGRKHRIARLYRRSPGNWLLLRRWSALIGRRAARCAVLGPRYLHLVVPDKLTIYGPAHARLPIDPSLSLATRLAKQAARAGRGDYLLDLVPVLREAAGVEPVYHRTDTHWSYPGCLAAYRALCGALGVAPRVDLAERPFLDTSTVLDLGAALDPPRPETVRVRDTRQDAARAFANDAVRRVEAGESDPKTLLDSHAVFANPSAQADTRTVAVFGDSFAGFGTHLLTGMLAETFREVHFVWSSSIDWNYVAALRPDIVLSEIAERHMVRVPRDDLDIGPPPRLDQAAAATA